MQVAGIWRYPVKSLAGEALEVAGLTNDGVAGDRTVHVRNATGLLTGRVRHGLLTLPATTSADGEPLVAGHPWDSIPTADLVREHAGPDARLARYTGPERFDVTNLLVATDGTIDSFGHDIRRLRPNILIAGVPAGAESRWDGAALSIGDALIGVHSPRARCVVTSVDPDTGATTPEVFRRIRRDFGGELCLNCWVIRPGPVRVGDPVDLVRTDASPQHVGGWVVGAPYQL